MSDTIYQQGTLGLNFFLHVESKIQIYKKENTNLSHTDIKKKNTNLSHADFFYKKKNTNPSVCMIYSNNRCIMYCRTL